MKGEQKQGEGDREHMRSQQRLLYNSNKHLSSRDICTEWWVRCGKMGKKMEWHQHIFYPPPNPEKGSPPISMSMVHTFLSANKDLSTTLPRTEACCLACKVLIKYLIFPTRCPKTALPYRHNSNKTCFREAEALTVLLLNSQHPLLQLWKWYSGKIITNCH